MADPSPQSFVQVRDGLLWDRPDWQRLYMTSPTFRDGVDRFVRQFAPAYLEWIAVHAEHTDAEIRERVEQMMESALTEADWQRAGWPWEED